MVGCIAVLGTSPAEAQLRWDLVAPNTRRRGLGTRLLNEAVAFARRRQYERVFLWTVQALDAAARRYMAAGFRKVEERARHRWGQDVVEERWVLTLNGDVEEA